jgi:hypothetical protein
MIIEPTLARLRAYSNNINRYQDLLGTHLSDPERTYIQNRLREEQRAFHELSGKQPRSVMPYTAPTAIHACSG